MYYTNSRLLWPNTVLDAEYRIPETAKLQGLAYDFTDHSLVTYDAAEKKIMWISRDDAAVRASATVATEVYDVMGMCQFEGTLYILSYEGDGHAAVYTGSLTEARSTYVLNLTRHPLPYNIYVPPNMTLWSRTHEATAKYLRYHPDYCGIFNIGPSIYLILGVSSGVAKDTTPSELGQYLVEYEVSGAIRYHTKIDYASNGYRWNSTPTQLNGTAVAGVFHDGCVDLLCRDMSNAANDANIIHSVQYTGGVTSSPLTYESSWYLASHAGYNTDMTYAGRFVYTLISGRIYRSEITMFKIEMEGGWPNTQTIDLGNLCPGQTVYRAVKIKNTAPVTTYYDLVISSDDPVLSLSLESTMDDLKYTPTVTRFGSLAPGASFSLYIRLTAPLVSEGAKTPYQYLSKIRFRPDKKLEYDDGRISNA